jgi:hypothetical protein
MRNQFVRTYWFGLECHGQRTTIEIVDEVVEQYIGDPFRINVFPVDTPVVPPFATGGMLPKAAETPKAKETPKAAVVQVRTRLIRLRRE